MKGHCCAFPQDVEGFVLELPRLPCDVTIMKVVHCLQSEVGSKNGRKKTFCVRRSVVMNALNWLKQYNVLYKEVKLNDRNLNWLDNKEEGDLETYTKIVVGDGNNDENQNNEDRGPAETQVLTVEEEAEECVHAFGLRVENAPIVQSENDKRIQSELQGKEGVTVDWPNIDVKPLSERDNSNKIFCMAFPWLFPGGVGDVTDFKGPNKGEWEKMMLYYEDGRFATDKQFCFFAENCLTRRRNTSSGNYFMTYQNNNCDPCLEDLQEAVKKGDMSVVNSMTYYSQRVKGSTQYWNNAKRSELYTWIEHHVNAVNGPPMYFMTLSCAEYMWKDVYDLIKERMEIAGEDVSNLSRDGKGWVQLVNDYAVVVQEYFQN